MKPDIKKRNIKPRIKKLLGTKQKDTISEENAARITNDNVAAHREEVLKSARKYIYPLQHSKHLIVKASIGLFVLAIVGFFIFCGLQLYKFQSTSSFVYGVTRVVPFPAAKAGSSFVSYDDYLFELRRYMHYYKSQQNVNFSDSAGKQQLTELKRQSMDRVIDNAFVKQLADEHDVSVSRQEVNAAINLVKTQNRLGGSSDAFKDVLKEFWNWSEADFRRELRQELLAQKVVDKLDKTTHARAKNVMAQLEDGANFAKLAKKYSDDGSSRDNEGEYSGLISRTNQDISPKALDELFKLKPGQHSGIVNTGYSLEIFKVLEVKGEKIRAAHIVFNLKPVSTYTEPMKKQHKPYEYISI